MFKRGRKKWGWFSGWSKNNQDDSEEIVGSINDQTETSRNSHSANNNNTSSSSNNNNNNKQNQNSKNENSIDRLFEKYKAIGVENGGYEEEDTIQGQGLIQFAEDIGVDPTNDVIMLIILWKLDSQTQYELSRSEFVNGFKALGYESIDQIKKGIKELRKVRDNKREFRKFYTFVFDYLKEEEARTLPAETAIEAWKVVLQDKVPYLDIWCDFVSEQGKAVTRDSWQQFFDFINEFPTKDFSSYDASGAWPLLLDEFVEYVNKKSE